MNNLNINLPYQPNATEFQNAFGDNLNAVGNSNVFGDPDPGMGNADMLQDDYLNAGGLLSRIIGTPESRRASVDRIAGNVRDTVKKVVSTPARVVSRVVGTKESRQKSREKIIGKLKTYYLAPSRGAFLGLVRLNVFGMASKLKEEKDKNSSKWDEMRNTKWAKWGGNRTELDSAVNKGSNLKPLTIKFKRNSNADGTGEIIVEYDEKRAKENGLDQYRYPTGVEEATALLTASAPIVVAALSLLGMKLDDKETQDNLEAQADDTLNELERQGGQKEEFINLPSSQNNIYWLYGGIGVLLIGGLSYYLWTLSKSK